MAGHSKWANIKHAKARQDKKRGKIFTKLIREITVAARLGGGDPGANPRLRDAVYKARSSNMPKDTIERAIKRGAGDSDSDQLMETRYEGYGPAGVAVMIDCLTDNKNRTVAEVRHAFSKCGGNLGTDGSVAYLFTKIGMLTFAPGSDEDKIMEVALEAGADDITNNDDGSIDVTTPHEQFATVRDAMVEAGLTPAEADITMLAATEVTLNETQAEKMVRLSDLLEDLDDVQHVYSNANIPDDVFNTL